MMVTRIVKLQDQSSPSSKRFYLIYLSICVHRRLRFINISMYTYFFCKHWTAMQEETPTIMLVNPQCLMLYKYGVSSSIDSCYCIFVDNDGGSNIHMSMEAAVWTPSSLINTNILWPQATVLFVSLFSEVFTSRKFFFPHSKIIPSCFKCYSHFEIISLNL